MALENSLFFLTLQFRTRSFNINFKCSSLLYQSQSRHAIQFLTACYLITTISIPIDNQSQPMRVEKFIALQYILTVYRTHPVFHLPCPASDRATLSSHFTSLFIIAIDAQLYREAQNRDRFCERHLASPWARENGTWLLWFWSFNIGSSTASLVSVRMMCLLNETVQLRRLID